MKTVRGPLKKTGLLKQIDEKSLDFIGSAKSRGYKCATPSRVPDLAETQPIVISLNQMFLRALNCDFQTPQAICPSGSGRDWTQTGSKLCLPALCSELYCGCLGQRRRQGAMVSLLGLVLQLISSNVCTTEVRSSPRTPFAKSMQKRVPLGGSAGPQELGLAWSQIKQSSKESCCDSLAFTAQHGG